MRNANLQRRRERITKKKKLRKIKREGMGRESKPFDNASVELRTHDGIPPNSHSAHIYGP
jgi:hypothetical protein